MTSGRRFHENQPVSRPAVKGSSPEVNSNESLYRTTGNCWKHSSAIPAIRYSATPGDASFAPYGDFFQFFQNGKLMTIRFDRKTGAISGPYELRFLPRSETVKPEDTRLIRGPGLVFERQEFTSSVWLMKLLDAK
jgi:hypothetical protein